MFLVTLLSIVICTIMSVYPGESADPPINSSYLRSQQINVSKSNNKSRFLHYWNWFVRYTFESPDFEYIALSLSNWINSFNSIQSKNFPRNVVKDGNPQARSNRLYTFKKLQEYFWTICFGPDLPFKIVPDAKLGGYKVIVSGREVTAADIVSTLIGFIVPLHYAVPSSHIDLAIEKHPSIIEVNSVQHVLFGPMQYVNNDCKSSLEYCDCDEKTVKDGAYYVKRSIIELGSAVLGVADREIIYKEEQEVTVRYASDTNDTPPLHKCLCDSCVSLKQS